MVRERTSPQTKTLENAPKDVSELPNRTTTAAPPTRLRGRRTATPTLSTLHQDLPDPFREARTSQVMCETLQVQPEPTRDHSERFCQEIMTLGQGSHPWFRYRAGVHTRPGRSFPSVGPRTGFPGTPGARTTVRWGRQRHGGTSWRAHFTGPASTRHQSSLRCEVAW